MRLYCKICDRWDSPEHRDSKNHQKQLRNESWTYSANEAELAASPYAVQGEDDGILRCGLCNKEFTQGHADSSGHKKYDRNYGAFWLRVGRPRGDWWENMTELERLDREMALS